MGKNRFLALPKDEQEKYINRIIKFWNDDPDARLKDVTRRFTLVSVETIRQVLKREGVYPRERVDETRMFQKAMVPGTTNAYNGYAGPTK